jgi:hypothetical protein
MTLSVPRLAGIAVALALALPASAQSVVYRCVDKEGRVLYTDTNTGNCKVVDSIVSGAISSPAPTRAPSVGMRQGAGRAPAAAAASTPTAFPRVDNATQRARDDDRRAILDEELRAEEKKLADLRRDAGSREDIGRAEKNVEALKREIANIR